MKLLLVTGIFPPDLGGPALHSERLAEEFSKRGIQVVVITYGKDFKPSDKYKIVGISRRWPTPFRQLIYLFKICFCISKTDGIIAFDSLGAGLPAVIAGKIFNKKVINRVGGDFLWEKLEERGTLITLTDFYKRELFKTFPLLKTLITYTLRNSDFVPFNTDFQRKLFIPYYNLNPAKTLVIENPFQKKLGEPMEWQSGDQKIILWAGRFIKIKNIDLIVRAFKRLLEKDPNLILKLIGDGPSKNDIIDLIKSNNLKNKVIVTPRIDEVSLESEIQKAYFCMLPSWTDIGPNFAMKCIALGRPVLLTQETGIKDRFPELLYADPRDEDSFVKAGLKLLDKDFYDEQQRKIAKIEYNKSWSDLAEEYLNLFKK